MSWTLPQRVRRKVFISCHKADSAELRTFVGVFSGAYETFLARGIRAGMAGDIIDSADTDHVVSRIRELGWRSTIAAPERDQKGIGQAVKPVVPLVRHSAIASCLPQSTSAEIARRSRAVIPALPETVRGRNSSPS